jgi:hypothetical protein
MLSTINSYFGVLKHANTYRLRKHIYHKQLGVSEKYFIPADASYSHLEIRELWKREDAGHKKKGAGQMNRLCRYEQIYQHWPV